MMSGVSDPEPSTPDGDRAERAQRGGVGARGVVLAVGDEFLLVTVMPVGAAPYRARVGLDPSDHAADLRVGAHVQLVVGDEPTELRLASNPPAV